MSNRKVVCGVTSRGHGLIEKLFSCYVSSRYSGDNHTFRNVQDYFWDALRYTEDEWVQEEASDARVVFAKTSPVTIDGDMSTVRSVLEYSATDGLITISVGSSNVGARLEQARFGDILRKIDLYISDKSIARKAPNGNEAT